MKNDPFHACFTLRQHTPMIHFQADESGATLRATDVKPRLDVFVEKEMPRIDSSVIQQHQVAYEKYYQNRKENTLIPYKLKIRGQEKYRFHKMATYISSVEKNNFRSQNKSYLDKAPYFADNQALVWSDLSIEIFCLDMELKELISKSMSFFFNNYNFGIRQSKGFGSFTLQNTTLDEFEKTIKANPDNEAIFRLKKPKMGSNQEKELYQVLFSEIQSLYQKLKTGINLPNNPYQKGSLFDYFCEENIRWEKRFIKETMKEKYPDDFAKLKYETDRNRSIDCDSNDPKKYGFIRALLGLAETNEYLVFSNAYDNQRQIKKIVVTIDDTLPTDSPDYIQRFASPILFKVFENYIYLIGRPVPKELLGHKFKFAYYKKYSGTARSSSENLFTVSVPTAFDLPAFLDEKLPKGIEKIKPI